VRGGERRCERRGERRCERRGERRCAYLQPHHRHQIQVVRRLVEQQDVGLDV
jgi:hypothetical protein